MTHLASLVQGPGVDSADPIWDGKVRKIAGTPGLWGGVDNGAGDAGPCRVPQAGGGYQKMYLRLVIDSTFNGVFTITDSTDTFQMTFIYAGSSTNKLRGRWAVGNSPAAYLKVPVFVIAV